MKIGVVRGPILNPWEAQTYYPLMERHEVVFFGAKSGLFNVESIPNTVLTRYIGLSGTYISPGLFKQLRSFDVVHAREIYHGFTLQCALLKKFCGVGFFTTCSESLQGASRSCRGRIVRSVVKKNADSIIAITEKSRQALIEEHGVSEQNIVVIPPGIDLDRFRPFNSPLRESFQEDVVVLFVGRLTPEKGVIELIDAMEGIWRDQAAIKSRLIICGNGELRHLVLQKMDEFPIAYYESFPYDSIPDLYNACDMLVLPSKPGRGWEELFGMVLMEAMACGKPIISTISGSIPAVVDKSCSLLVKPGDSIELRQAISELIRDEALRGKLGKEGRRLAEERYDNKVISRKLEEIYARVNGRLRRK